VAEPPKRPQGRPRLTDDERQTEMIRERCTPAVKAEYEARGGKAWLLAALAKRKKVKE
jgi:hypothetical protein